ncbi:MAG: peptide chain release factor 1 [Chlamydiota bacterium]
MEKKIEQLLVRLKEVEAELGEGSVLADQKRYRALSQEHAYLSDVQASYDIYSSKRKELEDHKSLLKENLDPDFASLVQQETEELVCAVEAEREKLEALLVPPDPLDHATIIMELRAGTGGDEAAIFVGDCVRMYSLYADKMGWKSETLSCTPSEAGGFKEYVISFSGKNVHRYLQYEAGTHRVQRVPVTEAQGRIHTSAITVAVLTEPEEEEKVAIDETELKVDTYRASGAGGQHVNTTDSAVRLTHIPTGIVVYCQQERSQHKNKEKALRVLAAKIAEEKRREEREKRSALRSQQVGSGDRSERIRTYNFPQNRVTEHRIKLTLYHLDQVMNGDLEPISQPLVQHFYQEKLTAVGESDDESS